MKFKQVVVVTKFHPSDLRPTTRHVHKETLKGVLSLLRLLKIKYQVVDRNHLKQMLKADLVIAVGGDGTVLAASHFIRNTPLVGINSAPQTSTGFFCLATPKTYVFHLKAILAGKRKIDPVPRLEVKINGIKIPYPALNEFLFASRLQGDTARYKICVGRKTESQKSSGVWVSTGGGSTGAIYSAGGKPFSITSAKTQYRVREPFRYPKLHYHLLKGFLKPVGKITLIPEMDQGMIFIDGAKLHYSVPKNARITVRGGISPLKLFL